MTSPGALECVDASMAVDTGNSKSHERTSPCVCRASTIRSFLRSVGGESYLVRSALMNAATFFLTSSRFSATHPNAHAVEHHLLVITLAASTVERERDQRGCVEIHTVAVTGIARESFASRSCHRRYTTPSETRRRHTRVLHRFDPARCRLPLL